MKNQLQLVIDQLGDVHGVLLKTRHPVGAKVVRSIESIKNLQTIVDVYEEEKIKHLQQIEELKQLVLFSKTIRKKKDKEIIHKKAVINANSKLHEVWNKTEKE
jgi:GTPase involved in cell partitioning and DNA repair